jgi:hypothetical protein
MKKACDLSLAQVLRKFNDQSKFDDSFRVSVPLESSSTVTLPIRWTINCRGPHPRSWGMTILMDNVRIDGVDHEQRVKDHRGQIGSGWHRHIWNPASKHSDDKECLDGFGNFVTRREFVRDGCELLRIELRESGDEDYGTTGLLFGQGIDG